MIRVLIAEDQQLVRQGLVALLEKAPDIEIVAQARDGLEAVELAERTSPDVVLMDLSMPRLDGFQAAERIRSLKPNARVLVVSMFVDEKLMDEAIQHGVYGYLLKDASRAELIDGIRAAYNRRPFFGSATLKYLTRQSRAS